MWLLETRAADAAYRLQEANMDLNMSFPVCGLMVSMPVPCIHWPISVDDQRIAKGCLATYAFHTQ
jgi:hypothetical protein